MNKIAIAKQLDELDKWESTNMKDMQQRTIAAVKHVGDMMGVEWSNLNNDN